MRVPSLRDLGLIELGNASPLRIQLTDAGALFAIRHGPTLVNQLLPAPGEAGLFQLLVRRRGGADSPVSWVSLVAPDLAFSTDSKAGAHWATRGPGGLACATRLRLHPTLPAWMWEVSLHNEDGPAIVVDVVIGHDLGLADEGAVRNNEAYTSQYIDLLPVEDAALGWVILARQNQPATAGVHPWLALAACEGAVAFATDGWQFFGSDHRFTGVPAAARQPTLPSRRLQYECAVPALQSRACRLAAGESRTIRFVAHLLADHPEASSRVDVDRLRDVLRGEGFGSSTLAPTTAAPAARPLFGTAAWLHGESPSDEDWSVWFPGERRHIETTRDGRMLSFFHGADTHVVAREKEAGLARPHGHILRSGEATWIDSMQFGLTCHAAGVFASQVYLGNPSLARLVPVLRNALGITRGNGQRIFVRHRGAWCQLGLPSAFVTTPGEVRWLYRLGRDTLSVRVDCATDRPASRLEIEMASGAEHEFIVSHELVLGATEYEHGGEVTFHQEAGWAACVPSAESLVGRHEPGVAFAIAAGEPSALAAIGGDELLHADGRRRSGAYVVLQSRPAARFSVILLGTRDGAAGLDSAVAGARADLDGTWRTARPPALVLSVGHAREPGVARVNEIVPWFNHNAAIHFSAPHGLEQYGGAAWGVRDVTQGSIEWLLAHGQSGMAARVLDDVFSQQYAQDGTWPQWYMHAPYGFIQQPHSHGDVCFWPVKALCDVVETANDVGMMNRRIGYTDAATFSRVGPEETYWEHCDRVVDHAVGRFVPGTHLVNYGDGDWDDTLQPADPAMRTRLVSAWTVALAYQAFSQLARIARRAGEGARASRLESLISGMARDFHTHLMPGDVVAGFLVNETGGTRPLLHPEDRVTGIRYRLLPMTRAILAGLFSADEARRHLEIIERELCYPDGARLMSDPVPYRGGRERWFKRADTAANVGREIGLQYVHAHLRYAEALARVGDAEGLWRALQVVNPIGLQALVPHAARRQANVYFSSSDADFPDRLEAAARWSELKAGTVPVRGGWRLYSSGPGLFLLKLRACLLGVRESFGDVVFDPVLPPALDGLTATVFVCGRRVEMRFRVRHGSSGPARVSVGGVTLEARREDNPYRTGGLRVEAARLASLLGRDEAAIEVEL